MNESIELQDSPTTTGNFFLSVDEEPHTSETESEIHQRNQEGNSKNGCNRSPLFLQQTLSASSLTSLNVPNRNSGPNRNWTPVSFISRNASNLSVQHCGKSTRIERKVLLRRNLSLMLSCIYAVFLIMLGTVIYISDQDDEGQYVSESFSCIISLIGLIWLIFLHCDLNRYKWSIEKKLHEEKLPDSDRMSAITEVFVERTLNSDEDAPYRFLTGRHSGSFYLKIGTAAFCFGHLIHEGLQLGQHIFNFLNHEKEFVCSSPANLVLHIIRPTFSFYQLFITFKYSNVVINRFRELARFGLMHLFGTCICFWFSTIVQEAMDAHDHTESANSTAHESIRENFNIGNFRFIVEQNQSFTKSHYCRTNSILSIRSLQAMPYLYPFTIEYNLILAGIWFIVWQNIGTFHTHDNPHHFRRRLTTHYGSEEIVYESNLKINVDCHASNKGLFAGLCLLLITIITVIVFFVAITSDGYQSTGVLLHTIQECSLTIIALIGVLVAYRQLSQLDFNRNAITFLDDVLLFIPLPFFFVNGILSVTAAWELENYPRVALFLFLLSQVIIQTPFIIDGLRRCSNSNTLRYKKPGREIVTFLIICNLIIWIVNTFEIKSVDHYHAQREYYGHVIWLFIGHTTLPLMLFYRFHSSVCLADIWKSAYERGCE